MKLLRSNPWRGNGTCRVLGALFYSTEALFSPPSPSPSPSPSLYKRILRAGDGNPRVSIVPVLDQWLDQGRGVQKSELVDFIRQLRKSRRFNHALQVSEWMPRVMKHGLSAGDIYTRLDLISKVRGLEEADEYFESVSDSSSLKGIRLYGTLLSCYVNHRSLEKAESLFSRMKQLGYVQGVWPYNTILTLYHNMGKLGKIGVLLEEMEHKNIGHNTYTLWIRLFWYAENGFVDRMDKVLKLMKDDPLVTMGWNDYAFAADAFLKAGRVDKALTLLTTAEQLINNDERKIAYEHLLCSYTDTGNIRDVYRIWHLYKNMGKFYNKGYFFMISSLVKLDDIDGAEKISEEWESGFKYFDGRVPKLLINAYCRKGLLEKAKSYVQKLVENEKADAGIWLILAHGYHWNGHVSEAVETMRKVASLPCGPGWKIDHSTLVACLDYLKEKGDVEGAHELLRLLRENGHLRAGLCDKIENYIHGETQVESLIPGEEGSHMEGVDNIIDAIVEHKERLAAKYGRRAMKGI